MLQTEGCLLPAIEAYGFRLSAPGSILSISLREVVFGETGVFLGPSREHTIVINSLVVVRIVKRGGIVHVGVKEVVEITGLLVCREIGLEYLRIDA